MAHFIYAEHLPPLAEDILSTLGSLNQDEELDSVYGFKALLGNLRSELIEVFPVLSFSELMNPRDWFANQWRDSYEPVNSNMWDLIATINYIGDILDDLSLELHRPKSFITFLSEKGLGICFPIIRVKISYFKKKLARQARSIQANMTASVMSGEGSHATARHCLAVDEDLNEMVVLDFEVGKELQPPQHFPLNRKQLQSPNVIGRSEDEKEIVRLLLLDNQATYNRDEFSVLPIVGIAGVGKTSLANAVFWNHEVKAHFRRRLWVWVDGDFPSPLITELIPAVATELRWKDVNCEITPQCCLGNAGKYLLVLDGLDRIDEAQWQVFTKQLKGTSSTNGSWILITTQAQCAGVATVPPHYLKGLSGFHSSKLLHQEAGSVPRHLKETGNQVIHQCAGVPLAMESSRYSLSCSPWQGHEYPVQRNYLDVFARLNQSFDRFDLHLKHCFAICSIFPMHCEINLTMLIKLWMAAGLIKDEEVGKKYFRELRARSFFDKVEEDEFGRTRGCKLHKLVHDFARTRVRTGAWLTFDVIKYLALVSIIMG